MIKSGSGKYFNDPNDRDHGPGPGIGLPPFRIRHLVPFQDGKAQW